MRTALYIIWFLFPAFFLLLALWGKLEQMGNKQKAQNPGDFFKQGVFVLFCVIIAVFIDQQILEGLVSSFSPDFIPLGFYQVLLLPLLLLVAAKLVGPTTTISLKKKQHPKGKRKR